VYPYEKFDVSLVIIIGFWDIINYFLFGFVTMIGLTVSTGGEFGNNVPGALIEAKLD
jgi:hypothetical protein